MIIYRLGVVCLLFFRLDLWLSRFLSHVVLVLISSKGIKGIYSLMSVRWIWCKCVSRLGLSLFSFFRAPFILPNDSGDLPCRFAAGYSGELVAQLMRCPPFHWDCNRGQMFSVFVLTWWSIYANQLPRHHCATKIGSTPSSCCFGKHQSFLSPADP